MAPGSEGASVLPELGPADTDFGIPRDYADAVIRNTLSLLATITIADDLVDARSEG